MLHSGSLIVIGLNHRTAPVEVRERFALDEDRRFEVLHQLLLAEGIEEAVVLATCNRTEFILWATDVVAAACSVQSLLARDFGLRLSEWERFYRVLDDGALRHVFRVASSLDSMIVGEAQITGQVKAAWAAAQQARATGRFLDAVLQKALSVAKRVRAETAVGSAVVSVPYAAVELARQIFGSLEGRKVMVLGAGKMGEAAARNLLSRGAGTLWVANRTHSSGVALANALKGIAVPFEERWAHLAEADVVISSTGSTQPVLGRADLERIRRQRNGRPILLIDIAVPRDIDPAVRELPGVFLYDIDDLQQVVERNLSQRQSAAQQAERLVAGEAAAFRRKLAAERVVPTIVAVRERLEEIRRQEMERYRQQSGQASAEMVEAVEALTQRIVQRVSNQVARELKQAPELPEQDRLTTALRQLFQLPRADQVLTPALDGAHDISQ